MPGKFKRKLEDIGSAARFRLSATKPIDTFNACVLIGFIECIYRINMRGWRRG